jgi:hypothetical protein
MNSTPNDESKPENLNIQPNLVGETAVNKYDNVVQPLNEISDQQIGIQNKQL